MKLLAIIPARRDSREIPNKNAVMVGSKPLIHWTIECALSAPSVERVLVTTDSRELVDLAIESGAEAPFLRPPELARDDTPGIEPIIHAITWLADHEALRPEYIVVLQPTSPLRSPDDIEGAFDLARERDADAVVSVVSARQHPLWMKNLEPDGRMTDFIPQANIPYRRQDLPEVYALNGAIYLGRTEIIVNKRSWYTEKTYGFVMPPERSLDVDTKWDLDLAGMLLRVKRGDDPDADR